MSSNTFRNLTHNFAQISSTINDQGNLVENLEQQVAINSQGISVTNSSGDNIVGIGFTPTTFTYSIEGNTATVPWGTFATKLQNINAVTQASNTTTLNINNALTVQDGETIDNPTTFLTLTTENHIPQINISGDIGADGFILKNSSVYGVQWTPPTPFPDLLNSDNNWHGQNDFQDYCPTSEIDATTNYQLCNYETVIGLVAGGGSNLLNNNNTWTGTNDFSTYCPTTEVSATTAFQIPNLDTVISTVYSIAPSLIPLNNTFSGFNTFNHNNVAVAISDTLNTTETIEIKTNQITFKNPDYNNDISLQSKQGSFNVTSNIDYDHTLFTLDTSTKNCLLKTYSTDNLGQELISGQININIDHPEYSEIKLDAGQITLVSSYGNVSVPGTFVTNTLVCNDQMYITSQVHDLTGGIGALNQVLVNDGTGAVNWGDQAQGPQGPQGDPGQQGDPGTPGTVLNFIGVWVAGSYVVNTVAVSPMTNNTYISLVVIQNVYVDPSQDVSEWTLYTNQGPTGPTGPTLPISGATGMNGNFLFSDNSGNVYYNNFEGVPHIQTTDDGLKISRNYGYTDFSGGFFANSNTWANYTTGGSTFLDIFNGDDLFNGNPMVWSEEVLMDGASNIWMNTNNGSNTLLYDSNGTLTSATYPASTLDYTLPLTVPANWSIDANGVGSFQTVECKVDLVNGSLASDNITFSNNGLVLSQLNQTTLSIAGLSIEYDETNNALSLPNSTLQTPVLPITDSTSFLPIIIGGQKYYIQLWKETPPP